MHVGVIGGTGHISASIVRVLLAQGHAVTCVNRGLRGAVAPGARLVRGDRRERATFEHTLQAERFDAVIDMLCFTRADALSKQLRRNLSRKDFVPLRGAMGYPAIFVVVFPGDHHGGGSTVNRGHAHHRSTRRCRVREGRPRRFGGAQRDNGT